jgi:hypothetical protein
VSPDLIRRQITVLGSYTFSKNGQADCATFLVDHRIDVDGLFTDECDHGEVERA